MRRLRITAVVVLAVALLGTLAYVGFTHLPPFGAAPAGPRLARARQSPQWHGDRFVNRQPVYIDFVGALRRVTIDPAERATTPEQPIQVVDDRVTLATPPASGLRLTWYGHSSTLVEIDGVRVLVDPFWSRRSSPVSWAGPARWFAPPPLGTLPPIDAVVVSHDHFDHLDYATIIALKDSSRAIFVVPLGIGAHLARWGVPTNRIVELDWWESTRIGAATAAVTLTATPARHSSGRRSASSDATLWAGFAMIGPRHRAWYSGDTGFHTDLATIGERLGPFDVTLIEIGQYDAAWPDPHLGPEQAVEAHRLVRGAVMLPVHWGALKLAPHGWTEPIERTLVEAHCRGVDVLTPRPGQSVEPASHPPANAWWPRLPWHPAREYPIVATAHGDPAERVASTRCAQDRR